MSRPKGSKNSPKLPPKPDKINSYDVPELQGQKFVEIGSDKGPAVSGRTSAASGKQYDHYDAVSFKKNLFCACQWICVLREQMGYDKMTVEEILEIVRRRLSEIR